ncbi:MAG: hypothetical protein ABR968_09275 [Bacteroidales bacterium]
MKRLIKYPTTIILGMYSVITFSQVHDTLSFKRLNITTTLTDYFPLNNLNTINVNIGSEIYLTKNKSLAANIGVIRSLGQSGFLVTSLNTHGIKFQVDFKHFLNKHKIIEPTILLFWLHIFQYKSQTLLNSGYYWAFHACYQNTKTDREESLNNIYSVDRTVYKLNAKIGYECIKKCGLTIDYSVGLGVQRINSTSTNSIQTDNSWPSNEKDFPWNKLFDKGVGIYPNLVYQFKLGWSF